MFPRAQLDFLALSKVEITLSYEKQAGTGKVGPVSLLCLEEAKAPLPKV